RRCSGMVAAGGSLDLCEKGRGTEKERRWLRIVDPLRQSVRAWVRRGLRWREEAAQRPTGAGRALAVGPAPPVCLWCRPICWRGGPAPITHGLPDAARPFSLSLSSSPSFRLCSAEARSVG
ncbi:hypothetical protein TcG_12472, partial [Trypanosoma cruzi]